MYIYEFEILGGFFAPSKLFTSNRILTEDEVVKGINKLYPKHTVHKTSMPYQFVLNGRKIKITSKEVERAEDPTRKADS